MMLDPHVTTLVNRANACEELTTEKNKDIEEGKENKEEELKLLYINLRGGNYDPVVDVTDPDFCLVQ